MISYNKERHFVTTVSPARDERDIDFNSLTATNEKGRVLGKGRERIHRHSLATPSEPISVNTGGEKGKAEVEEQEIKGKGARVQRTTEKKRTEWTGEAFVGKGRTEKGFRGKGKY